MLVLDTHALIWWLNGSSQLPGYTRKRIDEADLLLVSTASLMDAWYLVTRKRAPPLTKDQWLDLVTLVSFWPKDARQRVRLVSVDLATVLALNGMEKSSLPDPWDRLIVSTAIKFKCPLVTADRAMTSLGKITRLAPERYQHQRFMTVWDDPATPAE